MLAQAQERLLASLRDWVMEITKDVVASAKADDEWIDQSTSPLGRHRHLRLCRAGKLPARKQGKKWLVQRDELNRFIEASAAAVSKVPIEGDEIDRHLRELGIPARGSRDSKAQSPRRSRKGKRRR